ncbi:hypothetical protein [Methylobacterium sp. WL19]|uniref:hypothetical protein n=1 Tax=Methylobacterium sp. WL19 TaxID=2603896 RepID=UPI0011CC4988|nr:hypothetical protein [Methylobacterium sp. WL19]TXN33167.1 hypothetical protein FV220_03725 [Methylobacterium sp. WL19]
MNLRSILSIMLGANLMTAGGEGVAAPAENPSLKPCNCADMPEDQNLILADGSLADVRIIQIGEVNLYIPTSWARPYFRMGEPGDTVIIPSSTIFIPELLEVECPGLVHVLSLEQSSPAMTLWSGSRRRPLPGISPDGDVSIVRIVADLPNPNERLKVVYGRLHHLPRLKPVPGILVYLGIGAEIRTTNVQSPAIEDLVRWLASPPISRDNSRTFQFKVEVP